MDSSTGICWAAHSILRLPASASPMSLTSPFFISAVAKVLLLHLDFVRERSRKVHPASGPGNLCRFESTFGSYHRAPPSVVAAPPSLAAHGEATLRPAPPRLTP